MKKQKLAVLIVAGILFSGLSFALVQNAMLKPKITLPAEMKWVADPKGPGGMETMILCGDPAKEGLYTMRVKIPSGMKLYQHSHPDNRNACILSGTLYYAYGDSFDESKLTGMPAGSFFTEPAGQPHFAWAKEGDVIIQVTGIGPSGTTQLKK